MACKECKEYTKFRLAKRKSEVAITLQFVVNPIFCKCNKGMDGVYGKQREKIKLPASFDNVL